MSARSSLERILNRTTLTVQRASHKHVIDIGDGVLRRLEKEQKPVTVKEQNIHGILEKAEEQSAEVMKIMLEKQKKELYETFEKKLEEQKRFYERHIEKMNYLRDDAEEQRIKDLQREAELDKAEYKRVLKKKFLKKLKEGIENAEAAVLVRRQQEFVIEVKQHTEVAVEQAKEEFQKELAHSVHETKLQCHEEALIQMKALRRDLQTHIQLMKNAYAHLYDQYQTALKYNEAAENDFLELQKDYRRFLTYTCGSSQSDFLMPEMRQNTRFTDSSLSHVDYAPVIEPQQLEEEMARLLDC